MSNNKLTTKSLLGRTDVQAKFAEMLGKKSQGFLSSVLQIVANNKLLAKAEPMSVYNAAATAATLDLPINQNLGFAWIVPYNRSVKVGHNWEKVCEAQFQIGWKGFVQLAQRTGQYKKINVIQVHENQFTSFNRLTEELVGDFNIDGEGDVVGYAAIFELVNGMEKTSFWSLEKVKKHAAKYSQTYGKNSKTGKPLKSPWNDTDQFDAMAKKTVLKNTLSKWGILSIEMQTAQLADQAVVGKGDNYSYPDNQTIDVEAQNVEEESKRILDFIENADTIEKIKDLKNTLDAEQLEQFASQLEDAENNILINQDA